MYGQNSHCERVIWFQCVWRCFAADPSSHSEATWKIHIHDASNEENMLARMARRASLTLRKRRSSRMDSLGNHYRESMSSVFVEDKMGTIIAAILHVESTGTELDILMVVAFTPSAKPPPPPRRGGRNIVLYCWFYNILILINQVS